MYRRKRKGDSVSPWIVPLHGNGVGGVARGLFDLGGRFLIEILDNLYCICGKAQVAHYNLYQTNIYYLLEGCQNRSTTHSPQIWISASIFIMEHKELALQA